MFNTLQLELLLPLRHRACLTCSACYW